MSRDRRLPQPHESERAILMLVVEQSAIMNAADLRYLEPNDEDAETIENRIRMSGVEIGAKDMRPGPIASIGSMLAGRSSADDLPND